MNNLDLFLIQSKSLLNDAFKLINKNGRGICIVVKEMKIVGKNSPIINKFILKKTSQFYKILG